jgi:hypothetical protein
VLLFLWVNVVDFHFVFEHLIINGSLVLQEHFFLSLYKKSKNQMIVFSF